MQETITHTYCENGQPCRLQEEMMALRQEVDKLSRLVSTDTLSGLHNYRYFTEAINQEMERSKRTGQPTTLIMLDADHFKRVNDQWGHEVGNQALQLIAQCIKNNVRKLDIACRYGGEEFAVILPSTDLGTAISVAERIRQAIENTSLVLEKEELKLSASLGLSTYLYNHNDSWHKLVENADKELYKAKQNGRNQVSYTPDERLEQQVSDDEKAALFDIFKTNQD